MDYLLLTEFGLRITDLNTMKFLSNVKGWKCHAGRSLYNFLLDGEVHLSSSICRETEDFKIQDFKAEPIKFEQKAYTCPRDSCFCGLDIGIPKGKTEDYLNELFEAVAEVPYHQIGHLPHYEGKDAVLAFAKISFLLEHDLHIDIFMGKRCNFDCFYCSPSIHDNSSDYPSFDYLNDAYEYLFNSIRNTDPLWKRRKWNFTMHGGEPTLIPSYMDFIRKIHKDRRIKKDITTLTNFSRNADYFLELNRYSNVSYSVHMDYYNESFLKKIHNVLGSRGADHKKFTIKIMYQRKYREPITELLNEVSQYKGINIQVNPLHDKSNKALFDYDEADKAFFTN